MKTLQSKMRLYQKMTKKKYTEFANDLLCKPSTLFKFLKDKDPTTIRADIMNVFINEVIKPLQSQPTTNMPELFLNYHPYYKYVAFNTGKGLKNWVGFKEGNPPFPSQGLWKRRKPEADGIPPMTRNELIDFKRSPSNRDFSRIDYGDDLTTWGIPKFREPDCTPDQDMYFSLVMQTENGWRQIGVGPNENKRYEEYEPIFTYRWILNRSNMQLP